MRIQNNRHLNFIRLKELLDYDRETGDFYWKIHRGGKALAGSLAGEIRKDGYKIIVIDLKKYYAHRIAWLYVYNTWPNQIDHINGIPSDNRIANLRESNQSQNMGNSRMKSNNKSGFRGVSWNKRDELWYAFFRRKNLGTFKSAEKAYEAYKLKAKEAYGEFWNENRE